MIREFICNEAVLATDDGLPVEQYIKHRRLRIDHLTLPRDTQGRVLERTDRRNYIGYMCLDILSKITQCLDIDDSTL